MSTHFVQLKEASELTGKNEMTIRRLAKKPESKRYVKREDGKILVRVDYLYEHYPPTPKVVEETTIKETIQEPIQTQIDLETLYRHPYIQNLIAAKDETIKVLQAEVQSKTDIISQISERGREQNIIIQSLQDKLAKQLPESLKTNSTNPGESKVQIKKKKRELDKFEMLMAGVAILAGIALLGFIGLMIYAYLNR